MYLCPTFDTLKKVYELVGSRWEDQGTAFCYGHFDESTNEAQLVARSEADLDNVILSTTIRSNDVYQRQQGVSNMLPGSAIAHVVTVYQKL